jgi:hypothetical protein
MVQTSKPRRPRKLPDPTLSEAEISAMYGQQPPSPPIQPPTPPQPNYGEPKLFDLKTKLIASGVVFFLLLIGVFMMMGVNYNGYRTVVQTPGGTTFVKFTPGPYLMWFGQSTVYPDFLTYDFDKDTNNDEARSLSSPGINVRYQEGGTGTIYGQARFKLPDDEATMLAMHKAYRTPEGVSYKMIKPIADETVVLTANLMTSDESYMEKRAQFGEWARDQMLNGKYRTRLEGKQVKEEGTDKTIYKSVPVIAVGGDGLPQYQQSDLKAYSVVLASQQITEFDYEQKTLDQIQARRNATMAIITAKAEAERAKQDAVTAEENGKRDVMKAKYEKEVEKERAVVDANRAKEVAVIAATQNVDVAEQKKKEQEQNKLAMGEYKQAETLRGEGDAAYKKAVIEADGALAQKLATYEAVMAKFATEFGKQKWVPNIMMGGVGSGAATAGNEATNLINLLTAKTAKDLELNLSVTPQTKQ